MQVEEQQKQSIGGMAGANNVQLEFNLNQRAVRETMLHSDARSCWLCQGGAVGTKTNLGKLDSVGWRRGAFMFGGQLLHMYCCRDVTSILTGGFCLVRQQSCRAASHGRDLSVKLLRILSNVHSPACLLVRVCTKVHVISGLLP
jgi:hypothetical protein